MRTDDQAIEAVMGRAARHRLTTGFLAGLGALTGLSTALAVVDVLLLVAAPPLAAIVVIKLRRGHGGSS